MLIVLLSLIRQLLHLGDVLLIFQMLDFSGELTLNPGHLSLLFKTMVELTSL